MTLTYHIIYTYASLICGALERRGPETVPRTLTRSITLDIVDMSRLVRQYTEDCESVLPNVPKIDCLVSKLALAFKMIQLILLYALFCSVNERSNVKNIFCLEKPRGWSARRARAFCAVMVILPEVV